MTAAKIMDVIARLPGCKGQAADAVSVYIQVQMEDGPKLLKKLQSLNVQMYGYLFHDTRGPNHGQTSKAQWFLSNEICTDIHLLASCAKDDLRKFYWDLDDKKYRTGNVFLFTGNKVYFCQKVWMT